MFQKEYSILEHIEENAQDLKILDPDGAYAVVTASVIVFPFRFLETQSDMQCKLTRSQPKTMF